MTTRQARSQAVVAFALVIALFAAFIPSTATASEDRAGRDPVRWIISLRPEMGGPGRLWFESLNGSRSLRPLERMPGVYLASFDDLAQAGDEIARWLASPAVRYVEPDIIYEYQWEPNDPSYPEQQWTRTVRLPEAWSIATGKPSTIVAVVDSGVNPNHPDLKGKLLNGYDFLNQAQDTTDRVGHGTAVAGIVAARGNDGVGVAGAAMDVSILPVKVGNVDGAPVSTISQGIIYAVEQGASVINLSLGSDSYSATLEDAIKYAYDRNVVVVASAGNQADRASFPASYQQTISVGASTLNGDNVAEFSSQLSRVDLAAPGVNIFTTYWSGNTDASWASVTGTSFSAPIVSGTIGLMRSVNPGMSIEAIRAALKTTARPTFPSGVLGGGAGLLDAEAALRRALLPSFAETWRPLDQPVAALAAHRTWLWGPYAFSVGTEPYVDTQHGSRLVAYYDKARMEINDPYGDRGNPWYVTTGLLTTELISGRMQVGNNAFEQRAPAAVPVAGDPDDATGPRYASFTGLTGASALAEGTTITQTIDRAGNVGDDGRFAAYGVTAADFIPETGHTVASVFSDYLVSTGTVAVNGQFQEGPLFTPAFFATGYPITEAYWAQVKVKGQVQDVLVQCFERRCLTYTPANPEGWKVEMANVGSHYYRWRFGQPPAGPAPDDPVAVADTLH